MPEVSIGESSFALGDFRVSAAATTSEFPGPCARGIIFYFEGVLFLRRERYTVAANRIARL